MVIVVVVDVDDLVVEGDLVVGVGVGDEDPLSVLLLLIVFFPHT